MSEVLDEQDEFTDGADEALEKNAQTLRSMIFMLGVSFVFWFAAYKGVAAFLSAVK